MSVLKKLIDFATFLFFGGFGFVIEKSIGIGIGKSIRFGIVNIWYRKKISDWVLQKV